VSLRSKRAPVARPLATTPPPPSCCVYGKGLFPMARPAGRAAPLRQRARRRGSQLPPMVFHPSFSSVPAPAGLPTPACGRYARRCAELPVWRACLLHHRAKWPNRQRLFVDERKLGGRASPGTETIPGQHHGRNTRWIALHLGTQRFGFAPPFRAWAHPAKDYSAGARDFRTTRAKMSPRPDRVVSRRKNLGAHKSVVSSPKADFN